MTLAAGVKFEGQMSAGMHSNLVYLGVWSSFSRRCRNGAVVEGNGILLASGGLSWPGLNLAMLTSPATSPEDLRVRLAFAAQYYSERNRMWLAVLYEPWICHTAQAELSAWGLQYTEDAVGMTAERLRTPAHPLPRLEFVEARNESDRLAFADINADAYGIPDAWIRETVDSGPHWLPPAQIFLGCTGGEPATAAMIQPYEDSLFLGWVATRRAFQRRGLAEAVVRYAVAQAQRRSGKKNMVLHATPLAVDLYRSLGFEAVARFGLYVGGLPVASHSLRREQGDSDLALSA